MCVCIIVKCVTTDGSAAAADRWRVQITTSIVYCISNIIRGVIEVSVDEIDETLTSTYETLEATPRDKVVISVTFSVDAII